MCAGLSRSWCFGRDASGFGLHEPIQLLLGGLLLFVLWLGVVLVLAGGASAPLVEASAALGSTKALAASKWLSAVVYPIIAGLAGVLTLSQTKKEAIRRSALQLALRSAG